MCFPLSCFKPSFFRRRKSRPSSVQLQTKLDQHAMSSPSLPDVSALSLTERNTPINSLATRLPPELLHDIFRLAVDRSNLSARRFKTKLSCARVCRSWYFAAEVGVEYISNNTDKSHKLAEYLEDTGRGGDVRSLDISWQGRGKGRGLQLASLIEACTNLSSLHFTARSTDQKCDFLGPPEEGELLGQYVRASLRHLHNLQSFSLEGDDLVIDCSLIMRSLSLSGAALSSLSFTRITLADLETIETPYLFLRAVTKITWEVDEVVPFLSSLASAPPNGLTYLDLGGPMNETSADLLSALSILAPSLRYLKLLDGPWNTNYIEGTRTQQPWFTLAMSKLLKALTSVETLVLGVRSVDPSDVDGTGGALPHLRNLCINICYGTRMKRLSGYTSETMIRVIQHHSFKTLRIPMDVVESWTDEEFDAYVQAAEQKGVDFGWSD